MARILVDADGLGLSRPGKPLFRDVSVTVASEDRLAVVGLNGTGKSTLLGVLAGTVAPEQGTVRRGRGARVTFLDQAAALPPGTVRAAVGEGWEAEAILDRLGLSAELDADVATLSGGQAKRVALARALVAVGLDAADVGSESDLLILDEPTNHLDVDAIAWLEERLAAFRGGLVLVTHDRHVLDRVTTRILELDRGEAYVHDGGYASYLQARADRQARAEVAERTRRNLARAELAWLRRGAPARTRKPKADVAAALAIVEGRPPRPEHPEDLPLDRLTRTPRLGDTVVELRGVTDGYGDGPPLFADLDLVIGRRARLAVVGPNGSGKSTLLDVIAGRREARAGEVVRGQTVRIGYYDQRSQALPTRHRRGAAADVERSGGELAQDQRVRDAVAGPARQPDWSDAALLERFWFDTDAQWAPIRLLSGGERRRLQLVLVLRQGPNVLLLDEPTNDLDLDTLRALEGLLETWPGALVVVSHDRAFLERTVDDVLVLEGEGHAGRIPGGYAAYEADRRARRGAGRATPRRSRSPSDAAARPTVTADTRARAAGTRRAGSAARSSPPRPRTRSTLRHLLRRAEADLSRLQHRRAELEADLAAGADDHAALARTGEELAQLHADLAAAEEAWLALAEEAESVGLTV